MRTGKDDSSVYPPLLHDPRLRRRVDFSDQWEILVPELAGDPVRVQLWDARTSLSLLAPSPRRLNVESDTDAAQWAFVSLHVRLMRMVIRQSFGVRLPSAARLAAVCRWFLRTERWPDMSMELAIRRHPE